MVIYSYKKMERIDIMFNIKKIVGLAVAGMDFLVSSLAMDAPTMTSSGANSGSAEVSSSAKGALTDNHEFVGRGEWWYSIHAVGWAFSDYQHRRQEHGAFVRGNAYADSNWQAAGTIASGGTYRNIFGATTCHWRAR